MEFELSTIFKRIAESLIQFCLRCEVSFRFRGTGYSRREKNEASRFEQAIVTTAAHDGGQGIVMLPGVEAVMQEVRNRPSLDSLH